MFRDIVYPKLCSLLSATNGSVTNTDAYILKSLRNEVSRRIFKYVQGVALERANEQPQQSQQLPAEDVSYTEENFLTLDQKPPNGASILVGRIKKALTEEQYKILLMRDGQGKTFRQIAEKLRYASHTSVLYQYRLAHLQVAKIKDQTKL